MIDYYDGTRWHDKSLVKGMIQYSNATTYDKAKEIAKQLDRFHKKVLIVKFGDESYFIYHDGGR